MNNKKIGNVKKEFRFQKSELTKKILLILVGIAGFGVIMTMALMTPNSVKLIKLLNIDKNKKRSIQNALYRLKKQKIIEVCKEGDETVVKITKRGMQKVLKCNFEEMRIKKSSKWDKIWRIIIFDIPNDKKTARDALRRKLKVLGFFQLQKSVLVYPYECKDEIEFITEFFGIKKYVSYIEANHIEGGQKIKDHFKLSYKGKLKNVVKKL